MPTIGTRVSDESRRPGETTSQRRRRVLRLRRRVAEGNYFVPSEILARDLLRHLGRLLGEPLPQQR